MHSPAKRDDEGSSPSYRSNFTMKSHSKPNIIGWIEYIRAGRVFFEGNTENGERYFGSVKISKFIEKDRSAIQPGHYIEVCKNGQLRIYEDKTPIFIQPALYTRNEILRYRQKSHLSIGIWRFVEYCIKSIGATGKAGV